MSAAVRYPMERTCDLSTAGEYQSILFEIVGCADFAESAVDDHGDVREYTPEEYDEAKAALPASSQRGLDHRRMRLVDAAAMSRAPPCELPCSHRVTRV
jgi:hypothetical protein